jgi:hypothetical protein
MLENEDHGYGKHFCLTVQYMLLKSIYEQGESLLVLQGTGQVRLHELAVQKIKSTYKHNDVK